jgi:hypothetical protein
MATFGVRESKKKIPFADKKAETQNPWCDARIFGLSHCACSLLCSATAGITKSGQEPTWCEIRSHLLEALPLDPLTATDDEDFLERMTKQQRLPEPIKQGLPLSTAHLCNDSAGFIVK